MLMGIWVGRWVGGESESVGALECGEGPLDRGCREGNGKAVMRMFE